MFIYVGARFWRRHLTNEVSLVSVTSKLEAVRVSGGHLCEAEAPTESGDETRAPVNNIWDFFIYITSFIVLYVDFCGSA